MLRESSQPVTPQDMDDGNGLVWKSQETRLKLSEEVVGTEASQQEPQEANEGKRSTMEIWRSEQVDNHNEPVQHANEEGNAKYKDWWPVNKILAERVRTGSPPMFLFQFKSGEEAWCRSNRVSVAAKQAYYKEQRDQGKMRRKKEDSNRTAVENLIAKFGH